MRLALALLLVPALAAADSAEQLYADGRALLQHGRPAEACTKFEAALALDPQAPGVLLNLGLCNEQQHKLASALKWFRKAQTLAAEHDMAEVEQAAKQKAIALAPIVPTVRIDVPARVAVVLDGARIDPTSLARLEIDAGHHVIELRGDGAYEQPQPVDVPATASNQPLALRVMKPVPAVDPGASRKHTARVIGVIGGAVLLADGVVCLYGRHAFDSTHDLATRQRWKGVVGIGGTGIFAAGLATIGVATYLYVTAPEQPAIVPVAAPDHFGLALVGAF